jgi:hypothetical protein
MGKVIEDTSDSECDLPRSSYEIPKRYGSDCSYCSGDSFDSFGEDIWERNQMLSWRIEYEAQLNATRARQPRRAACHITVTTADLDGTWELPSLAESDCDGELELIRYTICTSAMAFEDSAAAAVAWERSLSLGSRLDRTFSLCLPTSVSEGLLGKPTRLPSTPACSKSTFGKALNQARSQTAPTRATSGESSPQIPSE